MTIGEWIRRSLVYPYCEECGRLFADIPDAELRVHWLGECGAHEHEKTPR